MEHEIRVPISPATAQLLDALSATWHCSYRDVLSRCVDQAAREQAQRTRLLAVIVREQDLQRAATNLDPRPPQVPSQRVGDHQAWRFCQSEHRGRI